MRWTLQVHRFFLIKFYQAICPVGCRLWTMDDYPQLNIIKKQFIKCG
jgi:hypothetical protein